MAAQQRAESLVDERLGFGVECGRGFVENQDVGVLEERTGDGDALLLATGELGAACADGCFETVGLEDTSVFVGERDD